MSHLLDEARKLYEDVSRINSTINFLEKTREEKINYAKNKMIKFAEKCIISVAKKLNYTASEIKWGSRRILSWKEYKEGYRGWLETLNFPEHLQLYLKNDGKNIVFRIEINISLRDGPKVQITPVREYKALAQPHELDLDSPENSLKEYIEKCERELFH